MQGFGRVVTAAVMALAAVLFSSSAHAQLLHTWVASNGNDGANCDRPTPCATFQTAFNKTNSGGEITCVDSGNFGFIQPINHSITINCEGAIASVLSGNQIGPFIINAGFADIVVLRGIDCDGARFSSAANIQFTGSGVLHVQKTKISHFAAPGISFTPSGPAQLYISDSYIIDNKFSGGTAGILVQPASGGSARAMIERTVIANNDLGIVIDGSSGTGRTVVEINDGVVAGNAANGITVNQAGMVINRTAVEGNAGNGILAGPGALIHLNASAVTTNTFGGLAYNGGQIFSYQNNATKGNGIDNAPSGVLTLN